jgi:hypothetical protein
MRAVEIGALQAETVGGRPVRKILVNRAYDDGSKFFRCGLEHMTWKTAE